MKPKDVVSFASLLLFACFGTAVLMHLYMSHEENRREELRWIRDDMESMEERLAELSPKENEA